jgi:hypothetical protein
VPKSWGFLPYLTNHRLGNSWRKWTWTYQVDLDVLRVEPFERPIPRLREEDEDGEDLRGVQPGRSPSLTCPAAQQLPLPLRLEALPNGGNGAKEIEYTHTDTSNRADGL